jgi:hypothetical protein
MDVLRLAGWVELHVAHYPPAGDYVVETGSSPHRRLEILYMFRGFAIPQKTACKPRPLAGSARRPRRCLTPVITTKRQKLSIKKELRVVISLLVIVFIIAFPYRGEG